MAIIMAMCSIELQPVFLALDDLYLLSDGPIGSLHTRAQN